ncbi:DNA repair protein RadC [Lactobacillus sp. ESL0731]|uniref:JAB domain-containing protein n=1 Tax=unclassified Lactobacillus TaxID=2620435 RepID=UPI0023F7A162|nr:MULTISPECIES: JAB domain-containing protein [unclassified Lactobacillus]WEV51913.1 DNA repair protein RadC [Lactobacillus sp. ESL0700]WEV63044.1 DNA repair protein RadC [Lactobacillus sp. ESL0731]
MEIIKSNHYLVNTDIELLGNLFNQLRANGISDLTQVEAKLAQLQIASFNDLVKYFSGSNCDPQLAVVGEELIDRLRTAVPDREAVLTSSNEVGTYLADKLAGHKQEELWAIYIDNSNHIIAEKCLFKGTIDKSVAHPREIFRWALIYACAGMFVVHNHPSGHLTPSQSDLKLTRMLKGAADMLQIDFLDHFIVGKNQFLSMREHELF